MPDARQAISAIVQKGGPVAVSASATTGAVTFGYAFQDANYQTNIEWVSGPPPTQGFQSLLKNPAYTILNFPGAVVNSAFLWQVWRIA